MPPPATSDTWQPGLAARLAVAALCSAVVIAPVCLGAVPAWPRFALEATMAAAVVAWACSSPASRWPAMAVLAIVAAACLQLVPLPGGLLMRLAPISAGKWAVADEAVRTSWRTVSIDPAATATAIRRLLLALATAAAVADLGRTATCRRWLTGAVGVAAVIVLATGWLFPVKDRVVLGRIDLKGPIEYWLAPLDPPVATAGFGYDRWITVGQHRYLTVDPATADGFGCYLNSNHFAGALCLTWPVALGAWLWLTRGRLPGAARYAASVAGLALAVWTGGEMAGSRAGAAALAFGGVVFATLASTHRWARWTAGSIAVVGLAGLLAFLVVFLGGFTGVVELFPAGWQPRMAGIMHDPRVAASAAALRMFRASPLLGSGLDTYGELATPIGPTRERLFFAHNDYAQALAETGLLGAAIAVAVAVVFVLRFRACVRDASSAMHPLDAGCWAALAGIAAHSCFDWNLHVPANAFLSCVIAGLALAGSTAATAPDAATAGPPPRGGILPRFAVAGMATACLVAAALLLRDACSERTQRSLRAAVTSGRIALLDRSRSADPAALSKALSAAIAAGERVACYDAANPRLAALLGQASLHLAALEPAADAAKARVEAADRWFARARRDAATFVDISAPVPAKR